jgi:monoamine oxidase
VHEERDRVGGRVSSAPLAGGVIELGAEFVLPGYEVLGETAERLGLTLHEKGTLYGDRDPIGVPVTRDELDAAVAALPAARGRSIDDALASLDVADGARAAIASRLAVSTAHELDDQPASILTEGAAGFGDFPSHAVTGGNDGIARALAVGLDVRLGSAVRAVSWGERHVTVDGDDFDVCVLATPAPATLALDVDPPLPAWKRDALTAVRYGHAAKIFLPLTHAVAPSATLSVPDRFWTWTQHGLAVASAFAGTASALEQLEVASGATHWAELVRRLRPDLPYADAEPVLATWPEGAYSARSLSSPLEDEALAASVGPLQFAGEHTARDWHALMEGALRSGLRAAQSAANAR